MSRTRSTTPPTRSRRGRRSTSDLRSSIRAWEIDPQIRRATGAISAEELEALVREEQTLLDYVDTLHAHARRLKDRELAGPAPRTPAPFELADTRVDEEPRASDFAETRVRSVPRLPPRALETCELLAPETDELREEPSTERTRVRMPIELGAFDLRRTYKREEPGRVETLEPLDVRTVVGAKPAFIPQEPTAWEREKAGARRRASARRNREAERAGRRRMSSSWSRTRAREELRATGPMRVDPQRDWYRQVISTTQEIYYRTVNQAQFSFRGARARARRQLDRARRALRAERAHPFIDVPRPWTQSTGALLGVGVVALCGLLYLIS